MATTDTGEGHVTLDVTHARQAFRGRHVLWVLMVSLVLVVLALFGAWAMRSSDLHATEPHNATQAHDAAAFSAPEPAAKQGVTQTQPGQ